MFVVFYTTKVKDEIAGGFVDHFQIVEDEEQAISGLANAKRWDTTYCAGYAPIKGATEPHWVEE